MSFSDFLYSLVILPVETLIRWIFNLSTYLFTCHKIPFAILTVSLFVNLITLPLYNFAENLKKKEKKIRTQLEPRIKRIKLAFKGDERFFMLSEYYRQNGYSPLGPLRSSLSILIEIPFFIAAFHFLSTSELLKNEAFWIFKDLGKPDSLIRLKIAGKIFYVNFLPVLMTLINFVSGFFYLRNSSKSEKIQLYVIGLVFLVLLYNSPSGLVLYWILNNLFSLLKNLLQKVLFKEKRISEPETFTEQNVKEKNSENRKILVFSGLSLTILTGLYLPSGIISSSPEEFMRISPNGSSSGFISETFIFYSGLFVFWPFLIYKISDLKYRKIESSALFVLLVLTVFNLFAFKSPYGTITADFKLENSFVLENFPPFYAILPVLISLITGALLFFAFKYKKEKLFTLLSLSAFLCFMILGFSSFITFQKRKNTVQREEIADAEQHIEIPEKVFHISKSRKNIIIIFLDRGISCFFPETLKKNPELKTAFEGFTYFPQTLSFGNYTTLGAPEITGGYEYNPEKMNERNTEFLRNKHNEALLVLPELFTEAGFRSTVTDPPWSNYSRKNSLKPFENKNNLKAYNLTGVYTEKFLKEKGLPDYKSKDLIEKNLRKGMKDFIFLESLYPPLRKVFYKSSMNYNDSAAGEFYDNVSVLHNLENITEIEENESSQGEFIFLGNCLTHSPVNVSDEFRVLKERETEEKEHFKVFEIALKELSVWFDYLKKNDVWDNSRIIIVSDHGFNLNLLDYVENADTNLFAPFNALFLFKDFNSKGTLKTDETFMTNADTLFFVKEKLNLSSKNPFTDKVFAPEKQNGINVYSAGSKDMEASLLYFNKTFNFDLKNSFHVNGNIYRSESWKPLKEYLREEKK